MVHLPVCKLQTRVPNRARRRAVFRAAFSGVQVQARVAAEDLSLRRHVPIHISKLVCARGQIQHTRTIGVLFGNPFITYTIMAIPPAIRVLGFATMAIFCWLVVQIIRAPSSIGLPGQGKESVKFDDMIRDPNLDGRCCALDMLKTADRVRSYWRAAGASSPSVRG